ncbi:MAG: hypothetical protein ACRDYE_05125 [Acidimicrobiales bacterium]
MAGSSDRRDLPEGEGGRARSHRSDRSTKWAIDRLDDREKRFSFVAAAGALLFGVAVYFTEANSHFHPQKGQLSPQTVLVVGLVGAALLFGATLLGRRAPVGFVALFIGVAFSNSSLFLALPFLALAIWILYRSYKIQRETAAEVRAARAESKSSSARATRSRAGSSKSGAGRQGKSHAGSPARPEANKRYTPKRPPLPAPKPSRRERKDARTSDRPVDPGR